MVAIYVPQGIRSCNPVPPPMKLWPHRPLRSSLRIYSNHAVPDTLALNTDVYTSQTCHDCVWANSGVPSHNAQDHFVQLNVGHVRVRGRPCYVKFPAEMKER